MEREKPIGVFDSGIGGLTVVKRLSSYLPKEGIVYFGDTARVPYGSKSNDTVIEYAIQDAAYLMQKGIKLLVVACNTVSSVALQELRNRFPLPIIGMIEPGANMALKETKNGRIGIIGTMATVNNKAYSTELKRLDPKVEVFETACPLFVPFAEEGWLKHKALYLVAEEYLKELKEKEIDTLVLGCTHYPLLADVIQEVMGDNVKLIDSGKAAAHAGASFACANINSTNTVFRFCPPLPKNPLPQIGCKPASNYINACSKPDTKPTHIPKRLARV
jgi:glutamate racemase